MARISLSLYKQVTCVYSHIFLCRCCLWCLNCATNAPLFVPYMSLTEATACNVPHFSVCSALPTAQTSAYNPPCALRPPYASCSSSGHLSWSRKNCQVHQPRGNDITGLLLWLLCSLWHPWGMQTRLKNSSLVWLELKKAPLDDSYVCQGISVTLGWLYTDRICQKRA